MAFFAAFSPEKWESQKQDEIWPLVFYNKLFLIKKNIFSLREDMIFYI